jgi:capsular polysaccharide biosynthesis protein
MFLSIKTILKYLTAKKTSIERENIISIEKQYFSQKPKNYESIKLHWDEIPYYFISYFVYERHLMKYRNVYATKHGVLFNRKKIFNETFIYKDHIKNYSHKFFKKILRKENIVNVIGKGNVNLYNYWSENFFHWFIDDLPRLEAILATTNNFQTINVYIPETAPHFVFESLSYFKVTIIKFKISEVLHFEEAMYTNTLSPSGLVHPNVKLLQNKFNLITGKKSDNSIVYISRKNSDVRFISNEENFTDALIDNGVKIIFTEKLSLVEQMSIFSAARIVISTHGAGLTNCLFMNGGTVIEIGSTDIKNHLYCFSTLASILNLEYYHIPIQYDEIKSHYIITNEEIQSIIDVIKRISH